MRIVTWNVNGIRRLHKQFQFQARAPSPSSKSSFLDLLESLNADIICFQELKSERSTIDPIYVNVRGWRTYFSFPVDKKAYSGVAVYVRTRYRPTIVETAICGPAYDRFFECEGDGLIGGYPSGISTIEARQVDREGRAVVLDFGGFVMIGTYCPAGAESDDRVAYRRLWWRALDERCRNLVKDGREVLVLGDLNVHCAAIDQVEGDEDAYQVDTLGPVGTTFYNLLHGSRTPSEVNEAMKDGVFVDLSRQFFPDREKMFTCWSVKLAAREGNYGSRIDFVLATRGLMPYVTASDIQPEIHGSDHCPVFADLDVTRASPALQVTTPIDPSASDTSSFTTSQQTLSAAYFKRTDSEQDGLSPKRDAQPALGKRLNDMSGSVPQRKSQKTISSFFQSRSRSPVLEEQKDQKSPRRNDIEAPSQEDFDNKDDWTASLERRDAARGAFARLFTSPIVPVCTGHGLPAALRRTKKKGANEGREFWMCGQPLGAGQCKFWQWRKR